MDYRVNEEAPYEMTAMQKAWKILRAAKKGTRVVAIIPPAVRTAIGEYFAFARGEDAFGKIAAALREIGADVVADGALGTDFAVGKAAKTLSERLTSGEKLPLVLSSPAWAEAMKEKYPEAAENVAVFTPALQFAALIRKYFNALGDGKKTKVIIVAPCKVESEEDILVLTTRELAVMFQSADINVRMLKNSAADEPFVSFSGAGVLPAVAGGLAESVVRGLLEDKSEESFKKLEYSGLRSRKSLREARIFCGGKTVKVAVAYEGEAADALAERIFAGGAEYDLVEIAECAGGCIMGEGQSCADERTEKLRAAGIYRLDRLCKTKSSMQNVSVAWLEALTLADPAPEPAEPEYEEEPIPESAPAAVEIAPLYKAEEPTAEASDPTPEVKAPIAGTEEAAEEKEEGETASEASETEIGKDGAEEDGKQEPIEEKEAVGEELETLVLAEATEKEIGAEEEGVREIAPETAEEEFAPEAETSEIQEEQLEEAVGGEDTLQEVAEESDSQPGAETVETFAETAEEDEAAEESAETLNEEATPEALVAEETKEEAATEESVSEPVESEEKAATEEELIDAVEEIEEEPDRELPETESVEDEIAIADEAEDVLEEDAPLEELFEENLSAEEELAATDENEENAESQAEEIAEESALEDSESEKETEEENGGAVQETIEEILEDAPLEEVSNCAKETDEAEVPAAEETSGESAASKTAMEEIEEAPAAEIDGAPAENAGTEESEEGDIPFFHEPDEETAETKEVLIEAAQDAETGLLEEAPKAEAEEELPAESKSEAVEENCAEGQTESADEEEGEDENGNEETPAKGNVPYHTTLSRKERRKLKRMKKFRH